MRETHPNPLKKKQSFFALLLLHALTAGRGSCTQHKYIRGVSYCPPNKTTESVRTPFSFSFFPGNSLTEKRERSLGGGARRFMLFSAQGDQDEHVIQVRVACDGGLASLTAVRCQLSAFGGGAQPKQPLLPLNFFFFSRRVFSVATRLYGILSFICDILLTWNKNMNNRNSFRYNHS